MKKEQKSFKRKILFFVLIILFIIIVTLLYARFVEPKKLEVKEYRIVNENLSVIHGYKIAHVSDIHYGKTTNKEQLQDLIKKINLTKPDILFFTGDLIDKDTNFTEEMKEEIENCLSKLDISIKKYAISGEDDLKFSSYEFIMENAGFTSLDDTYQKLYINQTDYLLLAGLKSSKANADFDSKIKDISEYIESLKEDKPLYSIFLLHEPDFIKNINIADFNLVLAGHSHGGQIQVPFVGGLIYPKYASYYHQNYQKIGSTDFYITSGIGTTTYGFRLFNPPSFNLYRLVSY